MNKGRRELVWDAGETTNHSVLLKERAQIRVWQLMRLEREAERAEGPSTFAHSGGYGESPRSRSALKIAHSSAVWLLDLKWQTPGRGCSSEVAVTEQF